MKNLLPLVLLLFLTPVLVAQELESDLQLRPRFEYRHGYKTPILEGQNATEFISQRSRLGLNFRQEKLNLRISLQNSRTWGEVAPNAPADKNGIKLFEAYAEYPATPNLSFRVGRQTIAYDDQRILGLSDWGQAGQSFDLLLLKLKPAPDQRLDLGGGFNTEAEDLTEKPYLANTYKNLQYAWYHFDFASSDLSFLVLNTGFDTETSQAIRETQYQQTYGSYFQFKKDEWSGKLSAYGQLGERNSRDLRAWYSSAELGYAFDKQLNLIAGTEYLSGTDRNAAPEVNHSFTPLFGTNHGFNGLMDYYYAGGTHGNSVGLLDTYLRVQYTNGKWNLQISPHLFSATADINNNDATQSSYLGSELDLNGSYMFDKNAVLSFGYSQYFGSDSFKILRPGNHQATQNWGWVMLTFHPRYSL